MSLYVESECFENEDEAYLALYYGLSLATALLRSTGHSTHSPSGVKRPVYVVLLLLPSPYCDMKCG